MTSLKYEIETWASALEAYDNEDWDTSLDLFSKIADNSKILTNIGLIYATLGEHDAAVENFRGATQLDSYLAIAYYQTGVSNFLLGNFEAAFGDFEGAFDLLRGNQTIDYDQIGLKYQLHACAVLFNQGITAINYGDPEKGMQLLRDASACKIVPEHDVVDEAIEDRGDGYSVFSVPPGILYRPNEKKVANMGSKDWMGKARLISSTVESVSQFAPRMPMSAVEPEPIRRNLNPPTATITRSRSANAATTTTSRPMVNDGGLLGRSASTNSPNPPVSDSLQVADVRPLALTRQKSMRNLSDDNIPVQQQPQSLLMRHPTLKFENDPLPRPAADLPPSPPRSETRSPPSPPRPPPKMSQYGVDSGLTDIYDGYLESDERAEVPLLPRNASIRKAGGGRPPMPTNGQQRSDNLKAGEGLTRQPSNAGSGPGRTERLPSFDFELKRIRVKLFFQEEARGMVVSPSVTFAEFLELVCAKFSYEFGGLRLKFEDEDGTKVSLRDEGDWEMAVETARDASGASTAGSTVGKPGEGKLMVWCEEDYR